MLVKKMFLVSVMGIFKYLLSSEVKVWLEFRGVSFKACINCVVFLILNVYGRDVSCLILCVSNSYNLQAGHFANLQWGGWVGL